MSDGKIMDEITEFYYEDFRAQIAQDIELLREEKNLTYKTIGQRIGISGRKVKYMIWNKNMKITDLITLCLACGLIPKLIFREIRNET